MNPETKEIHKRSIRKRTHRPLELIEIERLNDLEAHTDEIIAKFNENKQLALLAVADPVGVLREFGYELSPRAARHLQRCLPRLSHQGRDRYLTWLRNLDPIPDTLGIELVNRPSGKELIEPAGQQQPFSGSFGPEGGDESTDFDIVMQFSESFCERILQRHYADGRLPRSVYRIKNKLYGFMNSGDYELFRKSLGDADREVHFGKPTLEFLDNKPEHVRITSAFIASGFDPKPIKGSAAVEVSLILRKDSLGHPSYIEVNFDNLTIADVSILIPTTASVPSSTIQTELKKMVHSAYKDFRQLYKPNELHIPLTFTLVDSDDLAAQGAKPKPGEAKFAVMKPTGASSRLLVIGFNRAERKGSGTLNAVTNYIKSGGDLAVMQNAGWLEQAVNSGFAQTLPMRFDPDSGKPGGGDLKVNSIVWHYRDGGITGDLSAIYENWFLWVDKKISGQVHLDISFHSSDPTVTVHGYTDYKGMDCWERIVFIILMTLIGAVAGGLVGAIVGGIAGGVAIGALIGVIAGAYGGYVGALYLLGFLSFDASGIPAQAQQSMKQTLKVAYEQDLPKTSGIVKVIPNDVKVSKSGTLMSAKVIGPAYESVEPWVRIAGSHSVDITLPQPGEVSAPSSSPVELDNQSGQILDLAGGSANILEINNNGVFGKTGSGSIILHYHVASTYGLQGALSYLWTFNGIPLSTASKVDLEIPIDANLLASLQFNQVNHLGVLKLAVKDAFDRSASDSVKITVGNAKDLRAFRPHQIPEVPKISEWDWIVDPFQGVRTKWSEELISSAGWVQQSTNLVRSEGIPIACTTFTSPLSGEPLAVLGTSQETL